MQMKKENNPLPFLTMVCPKIKVQHIKLSVTTYIIYVSLIWMIHYSFEKKEQTTLKIYGRSSKIKETLLEDEAEKKCISDQAAVISHQSIAQLFLTQPLLLKPTLSSRTKRAACFICLQMGTCTVMLTSVLSKAKSSKNL